ncbi:cell cycle checkpoint protein [Marchantia polymorpha subsp. ruderalis]|uniref:Uncharacterized protein n=2 Tax=Marchantia polymorpha TaxID=3197 RepID=A0A176VQW9_MARPO|nr:hypothetical protein AXG93_2675s1250 [Marchantia polymorpha subsp. ruderalis]PTQ32548.1 hypothetical protein MARPO_0097s0033 [Marchantia polymorpha]BBN13764.1 hypothetical protein Mp_6g06110 [Marchantia polymorpha subsp. ruderalis]|eukprot:PTQ32548.1 hypothetical protein MARPO_0097s0033 [Marchantia polymorpha]
MNWDGDAEPGDVGRLRCLLDNVQGLVDALTSVRWKKQQDALCEISEHGMVFTVEEWSCLQARVYFRKELFRTYDYQAQVRPRFGVSLNLLVDCLNTFTSSTGSTALELRYPGFDMQLMLKLVDANNICHSAEIRTLIPDTIPRDFSADGNFDGQSPTCFAVKSSSLKEAIDDLEWPGSSIQIKMCPDPPQVVFKGEGHGDLQIVFPYSVHADLFIAFQCEREVSYRYKYKHLRATTANIPSSILKDNRGSKLTIGEGGLLKVQHLISVRQNPMDHNHNYQTQGVRVSYIEFYVMPDEDEPDSPPSS